MLSNFLDTVLLIYGGKLKMKSVWSGIFIAMFVLTSMMVVAESEDRAQQAFRLPDLAIDAERATYQGLFERTQDAVMLEKIELKPYKDPVDLLRSLNPSITGGHSLLGAIMTPELRGFDGKHTKVLIDGCSINTPWNSSSSLSGFPIRRLQKATVVPGGSSLVYGPNGLAGAVNLTLPTARDLEGLTMVQEVGGDSARHEEYIYGEVAHQNEHLFGVFRDRYDGKRHYKTYGVGGNSSDNLMFMYRGRVETDSGWVFKATVLESEGSISIPNYKERFEPWEMSHHDYVVEKDFGNDRNLVLRYARYRDYSANQLYTDYTLAVASGTIDHSDDVTLKMETIEALYNFRPGKKHLVTIGAQQQKVKDVGHDMKAGIEGKWLDTKGYFISDSIAAGNKLDLHLVARSDESFESDSETSWSVAANYSLTSRLDIGAGISRTVRFPNIQELYRGKRIFGNENLDPEKSDNLEFRLGYQIDDDWKIAVARFDSDVENKITSITSAGAMVVAGVGTLAKGDSYFINIDKASQAGWEVSVDGKINQNFDAWLSYTRLDRAEDDTRNLRLVSKPEYKLVGGTIYHQGKLSAMLSCEHQSAIKATQTIDSAGKATDYDRVDSSTIFNLGLRHRFTDRFSMYIDIDNIADKDDVVLVQSSDIKNKAGLLMDPIYYRDGRRVTLGAEMKF